MAVVTVGMKNAMSKIKGSGYTCPSCGLKVPSYVGAYPKVCPECNEPLNFNDVKEARKMNRAQEVIVAMQELLVDEKSLVNPADIKRLITVVKKHGKVIYKGQEYTVSSVSPSGKFIKVIAKGKALEIEIDKLKEYELDSEHGAVVLK